jgi:hypothetical protein
MCATRHTLIAVAVKLFQLGSWSFSVDETVMKLLPTNFEVTLALADVLRAAGVPYAAGFITVSSLPNVPKCSYRLIPCLRVSGPLSEVLSGLLQRPFDDQEHGWVIDAREARALVRAFNR